MMVKVAANCFKVVPREIVLGIVARSQKVKLKDKLVRPLNLLDNSTIPC